MPLVSASSYHQPAGAMTSQRAMMSQKTFETLSSNVQKLIHDTQIRGASLNQIYSTAMFLANLHREARNREYAQANVRMQDLATLHMTYLNKVTKDPNSIQAHVQSMSQRYNLLRDEVSRLTRSQLGEYAQVKLFRLQEEARSLKRDLDLFNESIVTAARDIKSAQPYIKSKTTQTFTVSDVQYKSNFTIFEIIDFEIQKNGHESIQALWALQESRLYRVLSEYPTLNRVSNSPDGPQGLIRITPTNKSLSSASSSSSSSGTTDVQSFSTASQEIYDALPLTAQQALESSLGDILEDFYNQAMVLIIKLPAQSKLHKFCPPFKSTINKKINTVFSQAFLPTPSNANLNLIITPGQGHHQQIEGMELPNYYMSATGCDSKGCRQNIKFVRKPTMFSGRGCYSCINSKGTNGMKPARGGGELFELAGAPKKRKAINYDDDDDDENAYEDDDDDEEIPQQKRSKSTFSNSSTTTNTKALQVSYQSVIDLLSDIGALLTNTKTQSLTQMYEAILGLNNMLHELFNIELLTSASANTTRIRAFTSKQLRELLKVYETIVENNDSVELLVKKVNAATIQSLQRVVDIQEGPITPGDFEIALPVSMRYSIHSFTLSQFWRISAQIKKVVRSIFVESSIFNNPLTGFSMGKLNRSDAGLILTGGNKSEVQFDSQMPPDLNSFLVKLRLPMYEGLLGNYEKISKNLDANITKLDNLIERAITEFNGAAQKFLLNFLKHGWCGGSSDVYNRTGEDGPATKVGPNFYNIRPQNRNNYKNLGDLVDNLDTATLTNTPSVEALRTYGKANPQSNIYNYITSGELPIAILSSKDFTCFWKDVIFSPQNVENYARYGETELRFFNLAAEIYSTKILVQEEPLTYTLTPGTGPYKYISPRLDKLKDLTTNLKNYVGKLKSLNVGAFYKKFTTPIQPVNMNIVDVFIEQGYGEYFNFDDSFALWFFGPSGAGKTYNQYTKGANIGLDSRLLDLPRKSLAMRDFYSMCFYGSENFLRAVKQPQVTHYTFSQSREVVATVNTQKTSLQNISTINLADYKDLIDNKRRSNGLIRSTPQNQNGSSRSFFITTIEQETGVQKSLVDTPGYEPIPYPSLANPFFVIYNIVKNILSNVMESNWTNNDENLWVAKAIETIHTALVQKNATSETTSKWLNEGLAQKMQLPSGASFNTHGIDPDTTWQQFIKSAPLFVSPQLVNHATGARVQQNGDYIINVDIAAFTSGLALKLPDEFHGVSSTSYRFAQSSKQNLCIDRKNAWALFWTWKIYENMFSSASTASKSNVDIIMQRYIPLINPADISHFEVITALEAVFINQFNFWGQHATLQRGSQSLADYLKMSPINQQITTGDLFYEFALLASDVYFQDVGINMALPRFRFPQMDWQTTINKDNSGTAGFLYSKTKASKPFIMSNALDAYDQYSLLFNPFLPLGDLSGFNKTFLGHEQKNLFVTVLDGTKRDHYFTFMDIRKDFEPANNNATNATKVEIKSEPK